MTVYEMAKQYYPRLWSLDRINALVDAKKLTKEEAEEVTKNETVRVNDEEV